MANDIVKTINVVPAFPDVSVGKSLLDAMKKNAERIAQIDVHTGKEATYADIRLRSVRLAQALIKAGIIPGDVITLSIRNTPDSLVLISGALAAGAVVNPLDVMLGTDDITHVLGCTRPRIVFTEEIALNKIEAALKNVNSDAKVVVTGKGVKGRETYQNYQKATGSEDKFEPVDIVDTFESVAFLLCSSGSTGPPKAVMVTHANVPRTFVQCMPMDNTDRAFTFTSPYWSSGLYITLNSCLGGATRILSTDKFTEEGFFKYLTQYEITKTAVSYILFAKIARHPLLQSSDLSKIRYIWVGGGSVPDQLIQTVNNKLPNGYVRNNYGQTEIGGASIFDSKNLKPGCVGKLLPGYSGKIVDLENNKVLGRNRIGELCLKSVVKVKGYYNNAEATSELFDEECWVKTGDVGYFDNEDFLFLVDRKKNMMRTGQMFTCTPTDLEKVLYEHPAIKTVTVVAAKGKDLFDVPMAFVILNPGCKATEEELQKLVADKLPDYKHLTGGVVFTEEIAMTPSGKIKIVQLKQEAQAVYDKRFSKL